ncbi:MAG: hypothetical protein QOD03_1244 [Verrucomicrobiota bacterium]
MFPRGFANGFINAQPVAHSGNFSKRHAGLRHAEGTGIHAEKQNALLPLAVTPQIFFVRGPRVVERIINVGNRRGETEFANGIAKMFGRFNQRFAHGKNFGERCESLNEKGTRGTRPSDYISVLAVRHPERGDATAAALVATIRFRARHQFSDARPVPKFPKLLPSHRANVSAHQ